MVDGMVGGYIAIARGICANREETGGPIVSGGAGREDGIPGISLHLLQNISSCCRYADDL
jgi:hypothetical protein